MSEKSGISDNIISKPSGGGAVKGIGETFSPDLFSGTGNFSVPIAVPQGRNKFQPQLTLGYSTGNGNGPYGLGWNLSIPGVMRKTSKGIPVYQDDVDVFILSGAEDLIPVDSSTINQSGITTTTTRYQPRTEGLFARIEHIVKSSGEDYWLVRSKDGLISYYGNPAAFGNANTVIADPENRDHIYQWLLYQTVDPFGNTITYQYDRDLQDTAEHHFDQLYLKSIEYNNYLDNGAEKHLCSVSWEYEDRPDPHSGFRSGFEMRTTKRVKQINTYTHPKDADLPAGYSPDPSGKNTILVKAYHMQYLDEQIANGTVPTRYAAPNGASMLVSVEVEGDNAGTKEQLPPLKFGYSRWKPEERDFYPVEGELPAVSLANPELELADLNGNGLPDLIQMSAGTIRYWENQSNGKFGRMKTMKEAPLGLSLSDSNVQLMDSNGDGLVELFVNSPNQTGYFSLNHNGVWDRKTFQPYKTAPTFSFSDPQVKMLDLSGNGTTDVLRNGERLECFFQDQDGFKTTRWVSKGQDNNLNGVNFADPRIRLADLSGDGLQDLVEMSNGRIAYWPNKGYGNWGRKVIMKNAPRFKEPFDPARLLIGDIDGDGQADLIYVEDNKITICINQSGNGWGEPLEIKGTPSMSSRDSVRLVDLNGTGVSGILWSYDAGARTQNTMYYLDLTRGVKPYVLNTMNNNMGAITHVEYISSVFYYLRDHNVIKDTTNNKAWSALTQYGSQDILPTAADRVPWKTTLPSPTQVVARTEVIDELSEGKLVTVYNYHHGYWDGYEREFRGFGRVDQYDTETFDRFNTSINFNNNSTSNNATLPFQVTQLQHFSPPLFTKNWFNVGPVQSILSVEQSFRDAVSDFVELDYQSEFWDEDLQLFSQTVQQKAFLDSLPRKARRDALRTLRGTAIRQEVYALDGTPLQNRPYTVTESQSEVRLEYQPPSGQPQDIGAFGLITNKQGSGFIFFPYATAQRSTQWERGVDPMTQVGFTQNYDAYGQPQRQLQIAVPRGKNPANGNTSSRYKSGDPYLVTLADTVFIYKDEPQQYMVTRAKKATQKEIRNSGTGNIWSLKSAIDNQQALEKTTGSSVMFYDGQAFDGLPLGEIDEYGALVRTETWVIDEDQINGAYPATPPCFENTPDWTVYPTDFQNEIPNNRLGYLKKSASVDYQEGFYTIAERKKYDFQQSGSTNYGLVLEQQDPLGNTASIEYDSYGLLPTKVTDPIGLESLAEYDYRILQANKSTDPNLNRQEYAFSPLGMLTKVALKGKTGQSVGDTLANPSVRMEYDFFAFKNQQQPVYVKTIQREHHIEANINNNTITAVEYSDGFGRLLQTRTQAEDTIYGNAEFGTSGLPNNPDLPNQNAVGTTRNSNDPLNVVVSGWKVYNNKGKEVEVYEPFFASGFDFEGPLTVAAYYQNAQKAQLFYDPRGQVIRTKNPDNTQQLVIPGIPLQLDQPPLLNYPPAGSNANTATGNNPNALGYIPTPWESYTYDPNDLGAITNPNNSSGYSSHYWTPKSAVVDAMGRTVKTVERLDDTDPTKDIVMHYEYDIRGNLIKVLDPYNRTVFTYRYNYANQPLYTEHIDSGVSRVVYDAMGKPVIASDAKGAQSLNTYDGMNRPLSAWVKDKMGASTTLRQYVVYGDAAGLPNPENNNLNGQPYKHYDEAGLTEFTAYDFKGNLLTKSRQVISDATLKTVFNGPPPNWDVTPYTVDWTGLNTSILDTAVFTTDMAYDALNRVTEMELPQNVNSQRKKVTPTYNTAGALEAIDYDGTQYVSEIAYNAKGQRLLIAYGNEIMTRYAYNPLTFRLQRYRSERFSKSTSGNQTTYTPQSGTARQDLTYSFDLVGNILTTDERISDCGISGTTAGANQLIRQFTYDPIYRLLSATGRESNTQNKNDYLYTNAPIPSTPNASNVSAYTRSYQYDKLGNVEQVEHSANSNNFTRNFNYNTGVNTVSSINTGSGTNIQSFTYDAAGNQLTGGTSRHYIWNAANQLKAYCNQVGTAEPTVYAQYLYDAGGNRVKKLVRNQGGNYATIVYIDGMFEYHRREAGTILEKNETHIMDNRSRIAVIRDGDSFPNDIDAEYYVLEDHLGSGMLRLKSTAGGTVLDREEYYPFGDSSLRTWTKKRYQYVGKEKDAESGLYYYGARYYTAWTCRFISVDPLAAKYPSLNPYLYAYNNPIRANDPTGMEGKNGDTEASSGGNSEVGVKKGDTITVGGKTYSMNVNEVVVTGTKPSNNNYTTPLVGNGERFNAKQANKKAVAQKYGTTELEQNNPDVYFSKKENLAVLDIKQFFWDVLMISDFNDVTVTLTSLDGNPGNIDGSKASDSDVLASYAGLMIPFVSGAAVKKGLSKAAEAAGWGKKVSKLNTLGKKIDEIIQSKPSIKKSFENGDYVMIELQEDIVVWRAYGGDAFEEGSFFGSEMPLNSKSAETMYNLKKWDNTAEDLVGFRIRKGTQLAFGKVEGGTGYQFFLPTTLQNPSVLIKGVSKPLK